MTVAMTRMRGPWATPLDEFRRLWTSWWETRRRRMRYQRTLFELNALSDRELDDIGIVRCDIHRLALAESQKA